MALAQSLGAAGFRVSDADEFRPTLEWALALGPPAVIEIAVDYRENLPLVQPMRLRAAVRESLAGIRLQPTGG